MAKEEEKRPVATLETPEMPSEAELAEALVHAPKKFMRCYAVRHGLNFNIRNDITARKYNQVGALIEKEVIDPGYAMVFVDHRCDVPIDPSVDVEMVDGVLRVKKNPNPKALIIACLNKRKMFGENEWRTAIELAKCIDDPADNFVRRMYNLDVSCGRIRTPENATRRDKGMSEMQFVLKLRKELVSLGYDPDKYAKE